jgi:hypothetical protein
MARPQNRQDLIQYCYRSLGQGAVDINVTDEQANDRVDDALDYFAEFHFDGVEKKYLSMELTANVAANQYWNMPNTVFSVTRIFPLTGEQGSNSINGDFNIFDLNYQLRLNELYDFTSADYVYFELANEHIRTLEMLFIGEIPIRYNRYTNILYTDFQWSAQTIGQYYIAEVYTYLPEGDSLFWNDKWLKRYTTALIKRQWGENLKKFGGTPLPGGITVNGQQIYNEAVEEVEELQKLIRETYEAPPEWLVG